MGLYDRDYVQAQPQYRGGGFSSKMMVTQIIIITAGAFLIDNFSPLFGAPSHWLNNFLKLRADLFTHPWNAWQLLTIGITHAGMEETIMHILFNMYSLWLFGRAIEQKYGSREFLFLYLAMLAGSSLVWVTVEFLTGRTGATAVGASGAVTALVVVYALNFPQQKFYMIPIPIPIRAWVLGLLIVGMDALGAMGVRGERIAFTAHLGGALFGALYYFSGIRLSGGGSSRISRSTWKLPSLGKSKLKIHDPGRRMAELDRRADAILEKVHNQGADSITAEERKVLDEYSRRVRQKKG